MTREISLSVLDTLGIDAADFEWTDLSICAGQDNRRFYEWYEANPRAAALTDEMCLSCPVMKECLEAGIENGEWGCWGGVYLVKGKVDSVRNEHKTEEVWEKIREEIGS